MCMTFVADGQVAVAEQPGDAAFDDPSMLAEFLAGFDSLARDARGDPALSQPGAQLSDVTGLVRVQFPWSRPPRSTPRADVRDRPDQRFECSTVVGVGRRDTDCHRQPAAIGHSVDLRVRICPFRWGSDRSANPLFSPTRAASSTARDQSSSLWPPSSSRTARCRRRHTPGLRPLGDRRCAVGHRLRRNSVADAATRTHWPERTRSR
jgi:hypothetical protein